LGLVYTKRLWLELSINNQGFPDFTKSSHRHVPG
jgi:hypothetical protein